MRHLGRLVFTLSALCLVDHALAAHDGPPFPIVSNQVAGPYAISVWTDPDTTDDGTAAGQFWVTLAPVTGAQSVPAGTIARVSIQPLDRSGPVRDGTAAPAAGDPSRQFIALVMDHEGRFAVRVRVDGPLGTAEVASQVDATYDLRPPRLVVFLYLVPFIAVGALWMKVLLRRRRAQPSR